MIQDSIKILLTGDLCPINRIEKLALQGDFTSIFNDFIEVLNGNDLNVVDLECPLTNSDKARAKTGPHQKAKPDCINILKYAGINLAALANNHMMDYGYSGVKDTVELCRINGISNIGVGNTPEEAAEPYSLTINGRKITFLNYADNEFLTAPDGQFYCNPLDTVRSYNEIRRIKKENDFLIVIIHAGNEFYELPSPRTKKLYRYISDIGADVVISHHTHAFSGYEIYNSKPIFYGLGNFIYDWPGKIHTSWNKGYAVKLKISENIDFDLVPLKQCNEKPGVFQLDQGERKSFFDEISRLNQIIADDIRLEDEFLKYCTSVNHMYNAFIEPNFGRYIASARKRGLFPNLLSKRKRLLFLNLIRCESHRDVLLRMLKENVERKK